MISFGWAVQSTCSGFDTGSKKATFAVNLVMPGACTTGEDWLAAPDDNRWNKEKAMDAFGELVRPWQWTVDKWALYKWEGSGPWTYVDAVARDTPPMPDGGADLRKEVDTWLVETTKACVRPFSLANEYRRAPGPDIKADRSLPHAMAPLTHVPARLSSAVFAVAGHVSFTAVENVAYVAFPQTIVLHHESAEVTFTISVVEGSQKDAVCRYDKMVNVGGDDCKLRFAGRPSVAVDKAGKQPVAVVGFEPLRRSELRKIIADSLHPLALLKAIVDHPEGKTLSLPSTGGKLEEIVAVALGAGAVGVPESGEVPRFPSLLLARQTLNNEFVWKPGFLQESDIPGKASDLIAGLKSSCGAYMKGSPLHDAVVAFDAVATVDTFAPVIAALCTEHDDPRTLSLLAWLAALAEKVIAGKSSKLAQKLADLLKSVAATQDGFGSIAWMHRLSMVGGTGDFWSKVTSEASFEAMIDKAFELVAAELVTLGITDAGTYAAASRDAAKEKLKARLGGKDSSPRTLVDPGVQVTFEDDSSKIADTDFRGYAIALQSGLKGAKIEPVDAEWVTQTGVAYRKFVTGDDTDVWLTSGKSPVLLHETIGSTATQGFRVVSVEYSGRPVLSAPYKDDGEPVDGFEPPEFPDRYSYSIDNRWPIGSGTLPRVGFGLYWRAFAARLDNAGGEMPASKASSTDLGPAAERFDAKTTADFRRYLSKVVPGAPGLVPLPQPLFALSDETRLHAWWRIESKTKGSKNEGLPPPPVALLVPKDKAAFIDATSSTQTLTLRPPVCDATFVQRWFNTDYEACKAGVGTALSHGDLANAQKEDIDAISDALTLRSRPDPLTHLVSSFHPAVTLMRVSVTYGDETKPAARIYIPVQAYKVDASTKRPSLDSLQELDARHQITVEAASANAVSGRVIGIKPGSFATLVLESLVEEEHFVDLPRQRFDKALTGEGTDKYGGKDYRVFGGDDKDASRFWFEVAEPPPAKIEWKDDVVAVSLREESLVLLLPTTSPALDAAPWLRAMEVERHEWHWTGYEVRLPATGVSAGIRELVPVMIGVASYRETSSHTLQTTWTGGTFRCDAQDILGFPLPAERGAQIVSFTARPIARFRAWLREAVTKSIEEKVCMAGTLVPGATNAPEKRLPVPAWSWSIPLCSTHEADSVTLETTAQPGYRRIDNGNLVVLDEAIRRTDGIVHYGGMAETIELDVVETWSTANAEQGVNPIFHGPDKYLHEKLRFSAGSPHGLTYDIGDNAKVAETAIVVTPEYPPDASDASKDAARRWLMCKLRSRRVILPDLMQSGPLDESVANIGARAVKDRLVPLDFCIDLAAEATLATVELKWADVDGDHAAALLLPDVAKSGTTTKCRLLVTWHYGRWGQTDDPAWRPQILVQRGDDAWLEWRTVGKLSPYAYPLKDRRFEIKTSASRVRVEIAGAGQRIVRLVQVSDYSEARWLTFIGSFGTRVGGSDEYRLVAADYSKELRLQRLESMRWLDEGRLALAAPNDTEAVCFQLLMIFRTARDVMRGPEDTTAGAVIGWWSPVAGKSGRFEPFRKKDEAKLDPRKGDFAYLVTFHRVNVDRSDNKSWSPLAGWEDILARMFPTKDADPYKPGELSGESKIRLVPEYLGPILIE